jgi:trans-2-enoyl-CoA reductase
VTHLIYKNGSAINVRKALHNNCKIVNLLWITNCKSEGKRLPEDKYLIHQPENLLLSSAKRRKSMEPGRVKALVLGDQSGKWHLISSRMDSGANTVALAYRRQFTETIQITQQYSNKASSWSTQENRITLGNIRHHTEGINSDRPQRTTQT